MKKAVLKKFIIVLLIALAVNSAISCIMVSKILLKTTEQNMMSVLKILDSVLDYNEDIQGQLKDMPQIMENTEIRFTVIANNGNVVGDNGVMDNLSMENHADRKEFKNALIYGEGYERRISNTLQISMLYVACLSLNGNYVLRAAVPFRGTIDNMKLLLPATAISFILAVIFSVILAARFSKTITMPLQEIAREMLKVHRNDFKFEFQEYQYEEFNVIAKTAVRMSMEVKEFIQKLEFEKIIRQEFFSNASHELKTPITSIRGYIELIENGMAEDETTKKDFLSRIKKETVHMTNLINDILMISRLETKEAEVVLTEVRMYPLLEEVLMSLTPLAKENHVNVSLRCKPITIYANPQQIKELLTNLISNAMKYNKPNGSVNISVDKEREEMLLEVADTGVGIPEDSLSRIFERFYRVDKGRSKRAGGTGLGLAIVKHIVHYYNGTISVKSELDKGSVFTVKIPCIKEIS